MCNTALSWVDIAADLLELQNPRAIPALEAVFADAVPQVAQLVVAWMKLVDAVESSQVLMRYALFHPSRFVQPAGWSQRFKDLGPSKVFAPAT